MHKIQSYPDGASLSQKFAPHLIHADAHAQRQMSASGAGGGGKPPISKVHGGMDDYDPKKGDSDGYGKNSPPHPAQRKLWEQEQNNRMTSERFSKPSPQKSPKKAPPQSKTWDDKKKK